MVLLNLQFSLLFTRLVVVHFDHSALDLELAATLGLSHPNVAVARRCIAN